MSDQKRQELIDAGRLNPDGSRIEVCPTCKRPFAEGEGIPVGEGDAVATPDPVVATADVQEV